MNAVQQSCHTDAIDTSVQVVVTTINRLSLTIVTHDAGKLLIGERTAKRHKNGTFLLNLLAVELIKGHDVIATFPKEHVLHVIGIAI